MYSKEGIAEQLALFADEKGIALLNTRGFLTEYVEVLSKKSEKEGCNIAILTDFDVSGLILATKVPGAYRIGIDFETLDDLGLDIEDVEEVYKPGNHLKPLQEGGELADVYPQDWVDYIEDKRVEINSVVTELDDNAKFWEWIVQKLREQFDTRNYNRAVYIPEYVIPKCLESLNEKVKDKGIAILRERRKKLQERLSDIGPGFLFDRTDEALVKKGDNDDIMTISKYEQTLADQSRHIIESHEIIKPILDKIEDLDNELSITRNYCDDP
jgi:5S rRNA maturation endonuclease (ribonuclease M5)